MKSMSIIGIVVFSISLICIGSFQDSDVDAAMGWGILGMLYAIPFSIVVLNKTMKEKNETTNITNELLNLAMLRDKGILSEEEFQAKKIIILKQ